MPRPLRARKPFVKLVAVPNDFLHVCRSAPWLEWLWRPDGRTVFMKPIQPGWRVEQPTRLIRIVAQIDLRGVSMSAAVIFRPGADIPEPTQKRKLQDLRFVPQDAVELTLMPVSIVE